jgi:hypothetical protein
MKQFANCRCDIPAWCRLRGFPDWSAVIAVRDPSCVLKVTPGGRWQPTREQERRQECFELTHSGAVDSRGSSAASLSLDAAHQIAPPIENRTRIAFTRFAKAEKPRKSQSHMQLRTNKKHLTKISAGEGRILPALDRPEQGVLRFL